MTRHSPYPLLHFSLGLTTMFFLRLPAVLALLWIAVTSALPNPFPDPAGHSSHRGHARQAGHGGHPRHPDHPAHLTHPAYPRRPAAHPAHPAHPRNLGGHHAHPGRQAGPQVSLLRMALVPRIPRLRDALSSSAATAAKHQAWKHWRLSQHLCRAGNHNSSEYSASTSTL